jgi:hypothetical protein
VPTIIAVNSSGLIFFSSPITAAPNTITSPSTARDRPNISHHNARSLLLFHKTLKPNKSVENHTHSHQPDLFSTEL